MIIVRRSGTRATNDIAAKSMLETLGVLSLKELEPDEFNRNTSTPMDGLSSQEYGHSTLIAPFSYLDLNSSCDRDPGSRGLGLPETAYEGWDCRSC